jgi:hypothetical protein
MTTYHERIEIFRSTGGTQPSDGVDGTSGIVYRGWSLNDEEGFTVRVPVGYTAGSLLKLNISEASQNTARRHKWQATVTVRKDTDPTNVSAGEAFTSEVVSSATAYAKTARILSLCDSSGEVNSVAPAAGDILNVKLKRIAASADEDAADIRVFDYDFETVVDQALVSGCLGRVGSIIDRVLVKFNEQSEEHLHTADIIDWINQCNAEIARNEYWRTTTLIDSVAAQLEYDLLSLIPNYEKAYRVRWMVESSPQQYEIVQTRGDYDEAAMEQSDYDGQVMIAFIDSNTLFLWPAPTSSATGAIEIYHSEYRGDLGCSSDYTPSIPKSHDMLFVYFCLQEAFLKDATNVKATSLTSYYAQKYEQELEKLFAQQIDQNFGVRPG